MKLKVLGLALFNKYQMKTKLLLASVLGLITGVVATFVTVAQTTGKSFNNLYLIGVMDQANIAMHIRAGMEAKLVADIETGLPTYVLAIDRDRGLRNHSGSTAALWMVKAYYERNQIPIPTEIRHVLNALPPKPPTSCESRLRELEKAVADATEEGEEERQ